MQRPRPRGVVAFCGYGVATRCHVNGIPSACLVDGDDVLWTGSPTDGAAILDAHLAGKLDQALSRLASAKAAYQTTHALDFALLDTYGLGLAKSGDAKGAARVGARVLAVCERHRWPLLPRARANQFIAAAR